MDNQLSSLPAEMPADAFAYYLRPDGAKARYAVIAPEGPPRGTFLIAQGRREFIEKKYLEAGLDLLARGYKIVLLDNRGQGLSSRLLDGDRSQYDHAGDCKIHADDMRAFYRDIVKPQQSGPLFLLAHSMGALIATLWLAEHPEDAAGIEAMIMTAPAYMIGVPYLSLPISTIFTKLGRGKRYAAGQHDYRDGDRRFANNLLSHDRARFGVIEKYFDANPALKVGGVTWGWLKSALTSMKQLRQPGYLERMTMPVLALVGGKDIVTPPVKVIPLVRRMPHAEIVTVRGAWHDILNEADTYRDQAWRHIDGFLRSTFGNG